MRYEMYRGNLLEHNEGCTPYLLMVHNGEPVTIKGETTSEREAKLFIDESFTKHGKRQ